MELEIVEEDINLREIYTHISVTRLADKLAVPHFVVKNCIEKSHIPLTTAQNEQNKKPERRISTEHILKVIGCVTASHQGVFPDLEDTLLVKDNIYFTVNPRERPQNKNRIRRGRDFPVRRFTFTP